jgi:cysteine desulfurase / selenocysteine lyase
MTSLLFPPGSSLAPRGDFPLLERIAYLDQAALGLAPESVRAATWHFENSVLLGGTTVLSDDTEAHVLEPSRSALAVLLGAESEDIAIVTSASEALCQFAWWLYPGESQNIVSLDSEFPSVTYPWLRLHQATGVDVRLVATPNLSVVEVYDALDSAMDSSTAVLCLSQVHYGSGALFDLATLGELADAYGAYLVIDGTQAIGAIPLNVGKSRADLLVASSHKWLCAPHGAAVCYLAPRVREGFVPAFVGWRSNHATADFDARRFDIWNDARCLEFGTTSYAAGVGLGTAANYLLELGLERIAQHAGQLLLQLETGLDDRCIGTLTPREPSARAGILTALLPGMDSLQIAQRLASQGVAVSPRLGGVRFSVHIFNDVTDIERALHALDEVLRDMGGMDE